jgi:hypothetical protein
VSYYSSPEALAANPPESWEVRKRGERSWGLHIDGSDFPAEVFATRREALAVRDTPTSWLRRAVDQERRWYAGEAVSCWKPYTEVLADRARNEAYQAKRQAERAA